VNTGRPLRRILRWALWVGLGLIVLLIAVGGAFFAFADRYDLASLAAGRLTASLERKATVGSLHVTPGRWIHIELRDLQLDNLPGGTQPIMATVSSISAEIEATSLLHGPVVVRDLTVNGLNVLLEHASDGRKNWKFGAAAQSAPPQPSDRTGFPTLLDAQITGDIVFRTSSGHPLDTRLDQSQLHAETADKPLRLVGSGSYNGTPLKLEADLGSLDTLRDATTPFPTEIYVTSGDTTLHFQGTMTEPLDVDGAKGRIELIAPTAAAILQIAGASDDFDAALRLVGQFEHDGPRWHLSEASGALNEDTITAADVTLVEGSQGKPDDLSVDLAFERLDVNVLLAAKKKSPVADADVPLTVDRSPDTLIVAKVSARELAYAGVRASDVTFGGSLKPGRITIDVLSLGYLGSLFRASGQIEAMPGPGHTDGGRVTANVDMARMDVQVLRKLLAAGDLPILGRIDGSALVEASGATLNQAARGARLSAVVAMDNGSISRRIIELASTDARAIFRKAPGVSPISCLVGVLDIRGGIGTLSPLRVRSADGTITGRGSFDIYRHQIDITIASEARTTSLFALDVPVRVNGSFAAPTIRPATLSPAGRAQLAAGDDVSRLLPSLQPFARRSPCLSARAG
jgi:AsmA family protein